MDKIWTVLDIVNWGKGYFADKGVDSPRLTIELLLCHLLDIDRINIYTQFERPLKQSELDKLRDMVIRRGKREPLQYITGKADFLGIELLVNKNVLIPRPETEILADKAIEYINKFKLEKILDIGTGSGCLAIAIAKNCPHAEVTASDVSEEALSIAKDNAKIHGLENINFVLSDILVDLPGEGFDCIVSNPPYIPKKEYMELEIEVKDFEPRQALTDGKSGMEYFERFADVFNLILKKGKPFFIEIDPGNCELISGLFKAGYDSVEVVKDFAGLDRIIWGLTKN